MKEKLKYFIINKSSDYARGIYENMHINGSTLELDDIEERSMGCFLTRVFDSGERGMVWHRLLVNASGCSREHMRIIIYSSDDLYMRYNDNNTTVNEIMHDSSMSLNSKLAALRQFEKKRVNGARDILLHDISGRYIWVFLEIYRSANVKVVVDDIRIFLPAESWIDHLPSIYRRGDSETHFLERYLGIFQTFYEELEQDIRDVVRNLDPECAGSEFLQWLSQWLSISDSSVWKEEKLRKLLLSAVDIYRKRGTRQSLSDVIELFTGEKPYIIEGGVLRNRAGADYYEKKLAKLYGNDPYEITVVVNNCEDPDAVKKLAQEMIPVTAELNFVVLEPHIFLGKYSYLGVNSGLGQYKTAALDGKSPLNLISLGGKAENSVKVSEERSENSDDIENDDRS